MLRLSTSNQPFLDRPPSPDTPPAKRCLGEPAIIEPSPSFVAVREAKGVATPDSPGLNSHPPSPWPSPWAGTSPTMSLARRRQRSWSASLSLPVACSLVMILGKLLCETADRECDAQPAAIAPIVPIPVILAAFYPCALFRETRQGEYEDKRDIWIFFLKGWNDAASAAARPFLSLHRKTPVLYNARWLEENDCHHRCCGIRIDYTWLLSLEISHLLHASGWLAGSHSHFDLPT